MLENNFQRNALRQCKSQKQVFNQRVRSVFLSHAVPGFHKEFTKGTNPSLEFNIHMIKRIVLALSYCSFT